MKTRSLKLVLILVALLLAWPQIAQAEPSLRQDCISYNPNELRIYQNGAIWILSDGSSNLVTFANQADAQRGMEVARLHNRQCFIGRSNTRPDRKRYIFMYWQGSSGLSGSLPTDDCIDFDSASLNIENLGANGWRVNSSTSGIKLLDNQADAQELVDVLENYDRVCYIGRGTDHIMTYLHADIALIGPVVIPMAPVPGPGVIPLDPGVIPLAPMPSPGDEDCISYDPNTLAIQDMGAQGWRLISSTSILSLFDNETDANLGLQMARAHNQQCFIGRDNSRPNRDDYIFEYFKGDSGLGVAIPDDDCIGYTPANLAIQEGTQGWQLVEGPRLMFTFDTQADAQDGLSVMSGFDQYCFIGRDNPRPDRKAYITSYLRTSSSVFIPIDPGLIPLAPMPSPSPEDCISYNAAAAYIEDIGAMGLRLTDGFSILALLDNATDASLGLQVAQAHAQQCFIGRSNSRPNREDYIFEYYQGDPGLGIVPPDHDCLFYDPNNLTIVENAPVGWQLVSSPQLLFTFDTQADALAGRNVFQNYDQYCFVGRDNPRPDRKTYILSYLRDSSIVAPPAEPVPSPVPAEDCYGYDPFGLVLNNEGALGWTLTDGTSNLVLLDDQIDAQQAATVALGHIEHCFIGRSNTRPDRHAYIFEYWRGDSGVSVDEPLTDCTTYNPGALTLVDGGPVGWYVMDGPTPLLLMDNVDDATAARDVMVGHTMLCYIGRDNVRPNRSEYVHTYLRDAPLPTPPSPIPSPPPPLPPCASAPLPRMIVGQIGRVTFTTGEPVRVRTGPGTTYDILLLLPEGTVFFVNGGPMCSEPYWWWSVQTNTGVNGWMAEGVVGNYFIEPFGP
jgi:hypothetical protein